MPGYSIEISWKSLWRVLFFVIFIFVLFAGRQILLGLFLAIVISSGLESLVDFLERRRLPRSLGVIIVFLVGALILVIVAYWLIPMVIIEINSVMTGVGRSTANQWLGPLLTFEGNPSVSVFLNRLSRQLFSGNLSPISTISDVLGGFGLAVAVLVSSFYLSLSHDGIERFIKTVLPQDHEEFALRIYHRSRRKMGLWFRTQIVLSLILGGSSFVALTLLGVPHAFLLAILTGIFELVPFVGPIISGAVGVIAAFSVSSALAAYTLIAYLLIHQLESNVIVPLLTRRSVGLHPVIVIISLLIGIESAGLLGAIVAVPAAAVFQEIIAEWSKNKRGVANAG